MVNELDHQTLGSAVLEERERRDKMRTVQQRWGKRSNFFFWVFSSNYAMKRKTLDFFLPTATGDLVTYKHVNQARQYDSTEVSSLNEKKSITFFLLLCMLKSKFIGRANLGRKGKPGIIEIQPSGISWGSKRDHHVDRWRFECCTFLFFFVDWKYLFRAWYFSINANRYAPNIVGFRDNFFFFQVAVNLFVFKVIMIIGELTALSHY